LTRSSDLASKERSGTGDIRSLGALCDDTKGERMAAYDYGKEVTLMLTVDEKSLAERGRSESATTDEGYASSSPTMGVSSLPLTISDSRSPREGGGKKFRFGWGGEVKGSEQLKRLEKEKEAEKLIASWSGRSLTIQLEQVKKVLNKEKRRIQFGIASNRIMDLALRRYSYKYVFRACLY